MKTSIILLAVISAILVMCASGERRVRTNRKRDRPTLRENAAASDNKDDDNFDGNVFLEKFGYLDDLAAGQHHNPDSTREAIREFQRFNGLPVSGNMDRKTVRKMRQPRCGLPDVIKPSKRPAGLRNADPNHPLAYYAPGYKWESRDITYKVMEYTRQLGGSTQNQAFANAFGKWANVVPLNFRPVPSGKADIEISFARRQHSDGPGNSFDGRGGTLAHAFFPGGSPLSGDTHFDDDEQWTMREDRGTNLEIVAAHEFGHALGMGHSNVPSALMAPFYQGYDPNYSLHSDDIRGIQSLYGSGRGSSGGSSGGGGGGSGGGRVTPRPTPRPTPPPSGRYCNLTFDAIAENMDGNIYAFRRNNVFLIDSSGVRTQNLTKSLFRDAPSSPGTVVYDRYNRKLYIFKGRQYWRYTGFQLDQGYPRDLAPDFQAPKAAFQWSDRGIYLIKGNNYMRWAEELTRFSRGYPRPVRDYWQGAPTNIEAALQAPDGYYYFFKGQRYWKYDARAVMQAGYPKDLRPAWLSCGTPVPR